MHILGTIGLWPCVRTYVSFGSLTCQKVRCAASPAHRSFAHSYSTLRPPELRNTLVIYAAPFLAMLHPTELRCTISELRSTLRSNAAPSELSSYVIPVIACMDVNLVNSHPSLTYIEKTPRKFQFGKISAKVYACLYSSKELALHYGARYMNQ
jgi:hypothetical protein